MTPKEIGDRLVALHAALVEKIGEQPFIAPSLTVHGRGYCAINLYLGKSHFAKNEIIKADELAGVLDAADAFIAALPTRDEHQRRVFYGDLAKVIDKGHDLNLPGDVMDPLRQSAKAMTENLLTHVREEEVEGTQ